MPVGPISYEEVLETIRMVEMEGLDIRTVTMGINLSDCAHPDVAAMVENIVYKIVRVAKNLVRVVDEVEARYGIPIARATEGRPGAPGHRLCLGSSGPGRRGRFHRRVQRAGA